MKCLPVVLIAAFPCRLRPDDERLGIANRVRNCEAYRNSIREAALSLKSTGEETCESFR